MRKLKLCFFIKGENYPYEGMVRPFINWYKGLAEDQHFDAYFILQDCGKSLKEYIQNIEGKVIETKDIEETCTSLETDAPDIILTDDEHGRLTSLSRIKKKTKIKTCVYVQHLFGTHSILDAFDLRFLSKREKIYFNLARYVPFSLVKRYYTKKMKEHDVIIANSAITATFLNSLYRIEPKSVIYPPVNVNVFKPMSKSKKEQVLVYLGSHIGDTFYELTYKLCQIATSFGWDVLLFGNRPLANQLLSKFKDAVYYIYNVSDEELAIIYSESKITICPQSWEQFGYVAVESMACGTPVLAFNYLGYRETVIHGKTGYLCFSGEEICNKLYDILREEKSYDVKLSEICRKHVIQNFSSQVSTKRLKDTIKSGLNEKTHQNR